MCGYIAQRQSATEIVKKSYTIKRKDGTAITGPEHRRSDTRKGFFELEMLQDVLAHLPESLRPVIEFAYITGWRIPSEVLTIEWRQVDFKAGEVRLDPGPRRTAK